MVICRGTVCLFFWVLLVDKYKYFLFLLFQKALAKIFGYLQISLFCAFLIYCLFVIFQKSVYFMDCVLYKSTTVQNCSLQNLTGHFDLCYNIFGKLMSKYIVINTIKWKEFLNEQLLFNNVGRRADNMQ